ncbi:MAG TPA: glycosyltransferase [Capsulimonadaceae bacterium]
MSVAIVYHLLVLAASCVLAGIAVANFFAFRRPRAVVGHTELPFVSVLIPARNEEKHIAACVRSLLAQNYPAFEVIVLDDSSDDATYDIVHKLRDEDHRLRVLVGAELPDGWCGKPHACVQLANAARGEWLLFTDADCRFSPDALLLAHGAHVEHDAEMVSLMPDYIAVTFWERVVIPLLIMIPIAFLPVAGVRRSRFGLFAAANGSFISISRDAYQRIGGHGAVRAQLAEDVKLAQLAKRMGVTQWYGDGTRAYSVRMYESWGEIWRGFTKNLFAAFSRKVWILAPTLVMLAVVMILPPFFAIVGVVTGAPWTMLPVISYALMVGIRLGIVWRIGQDSPWYAYLNPLSWLVAIMVAIASVVVSNGKGAEWKGRVYRKPAD